MQKNLTHGSVFKTLIAFSLPYLLSYFLQTLYGLADLFITGQFCGKEIITAVSVGSQIMHMLTVVIVGLATGATVVIGRAVGADNRGRLSRIIGNTVSVFICVSLAGTALLLLLTDPIIKIMAIPAASVEQTRLYLIICFAGVPFITAYNVISSVFRGLGDSRSPMLFIGAACVINIALDALFIGAFRMQAAGAALATVLAQALSVVISLFAMKKSSASVRLGRQDLRPERQILSEMLRIGVPIAFQDGFIQISFLIITMIADKRGLEVASAVGITEKIISFLFLIPSAMLSSISAVASQNIGARREDRARQTLFCGMAVAAAFGAAFAIAAQFVSEPLMTLFTRDARVIELACQYFKTYSIDCLLAGIHFCFSGYFAAVGRSYVSFLHNAASILTFRVPGAYLASKFFPETLTMMGLAAPAGSLLSDIICLIVFFYLDKKRKKLLDDDHLL